MIVNDENLKGFLAQCICKIHMNLIDYKVVEIGREYISEELSYLSQTIVAYESNHAQKTFSLYNDVISKLPDFIVYKIIEKDGKKIVLRFLEVKFRTLEISQFNNHFKEKTESITYKDKNGNEHTVNIIIYEHEINPNEDFLDILKYIKNIEDNLKLEINNIYFIVYLLLNLKDGKSNEFHPFIAKVYKNTTYKLDFYAPTYVMTKKNKDEFKKLRNRLNTLIWDNFSETSFIISDFSKLVFDNFYKFKMLNNYEEIERRVREYFLNK